MFSATMLCPRISCCVSDPHAVPQGLMMCLKLSFCASDLHAVPQVLMFSATMPEAVQAAAAKWQRKPVCIQIKPGEMTISKTITQVAIGTTHKFTFL